MNKTISPFIEGTMNKNEGMILSIFVLCAVMGYLTGIMIAMYSITIPIGY